jgi:hypothetical protein
MASQKEIKDALAAVNEELAQARQIAAAAKQKYLSQSNGAELWKNNVRKETLPIYKLLERRYALNLLSAAPEKVALFNIKVIGIKLPPKMGGAYVSLSNNIVSLQYKKDGVLVSVRTYDTMLLEIDAANVVKDARPVELKSDGAKTIKGVLASSVKGGMVRSKEILSNFRPASTIAGQIKTERIEVIKKAKDLGGMIIMEGFDAVTGVTYRFEVDPAYLQISRVTTYTSLPDLLFHEAGEAGSKPRGGAKGAKGAKESTDQTKGVSDGKPAEADKATAAKGTSKKTKTTKAATQQKGKSKKSAKGKARSKPKVKSSSATGVKQTKRAIRPTKKTSAAKKVTSEAVRAEKNLALNRAVADRGLGSKATELKTAGRAVAAVERGISAGGKISRAARFFSLTKTVGKFAVAVFLPLSFLDLAFQIALWIFESDQKRRAADKEEWNRIINFLVGYQGDIDVPFVKQYKLGINDLVQKLINQRLTDPSYSLNFLYWFNNWESNKKWVGFVYAKIEVTLMRQELTYVHPDTENRIRYFLNNNRPVINFAQLALFINNSKTVTDIGYYMPQDAYNLFTGGENNDPNRVYRAMKEQNKNIGEPGEKYFEEMKLYSISVANASSVKVKYIVPSPVLTPFDFVIFKCRNLVIEILQFIAKYEQYFIVDMPFDNIWGVNWYEDMQFSHPINTENVHWCINSLYWVISNLSTHTADYDDKTTEGKDRRWRILADVIPPNSNKRILRDISNRLYNIVSDLDEKYLVNTRDPELDYITYDYLSNSAIEIENDLKRMLADLTSSDKARAYAYEYRGDLETD